MANTWDIDGWFSAISCTHNNATSIAWCDSCLKLVVFCQVDPTIYYLSSKRMPAMDILDNQNLDSPTTSMDV